MSKVTLQNVRGSYVFITSPRSQENEDGTTTQKYQMSVLVPKDDKEQVKKLQAAIAACAKEAFGNDVKLSAIKQPLNDGETRDDPAYEGMYYLNPWSKTRPGILNRNKEPAQEKDLDEYCYSGAYFHVSVGFFSYNHKIGGKGVGVALNNVMLYRKGDRLDGRTDAEEDFEDVEVDDDPADDEWGDIAA